MKSLIRTISVIVVFALATGCFALAKETVAKRDDEKVGREILEDMIRHRETEKELQDLLVAPEGRLRALATSSQYGAGRVLVIPAAQSTAEELLTITEDMSVMSYIFDEKLGHAHLLSPRGYGGYGDLKLFGGYGGGGYFGLERSATQSIYLDGYGALFLMKVDFLLSPPAEIPEEEKPEEGVDPVWQEAKQKIFEPDKGERRRSASRTRPEEKYDAEKVEELKRKLIRALKHAANIRNLKPDEQVILSVTGRGESGKVTTEVKVIPESGQILVVSQSGDREEARLYSGSKKAEADLLASQMGLSSPTVMTIRAKKADVDAFSKGELDFDKFRQKVQIFTH